MTKSSTQHLSRRAITNAFHGERYARAISAPFNLMVTLNFTALVLEGSEAENRFVEIRKRVIRAWKYRQSKSGDLPDLRWVFVHESPGGKSHVHWLVYVPEDAQEVFRFLVESRAYKVLGQMPPQDSINFMDINNPSKMMKYLAKGVQPMFRDYFHLKNVSDQGLVTSRRVQTSRNVGAAARALAGWSSKNSKQT